MADSTHELPTDPLFEAYVKLGAAIALLRSGDSKPPLDDPWKWEPMKRLAMEIDARQAKHERLVKALRDWLIRASLKFGNPSNVSTNDDFVAALNDLDDALKAADRDPNKTLRDQES